MTVTYWKQKGDSSVHRVGNMPGFIAAGSVVEGKNMIDVYGLPDNEYPGYVKVLPP